MAAQHGTAFFHVDGRRISSQDNEMRYASVNETYPCLASFERYVSSRVEASSPLKVDLRLAIDEPGRNHSRVCGEAEPLCSADSELSGQSGTAKRCVAAQLSQCTISVEVPYPKVFTGIVLQENNPVGADTGSPSTNAIDHGRVIQLAGSFGPSIKEQEVVP